MTVFDADDEIGDVLLWFAVENVRDSKVEMIVFDIRRHVIHRLKSPGDLLLPKRMYCNMRDVAFFLCGINLKDCIEGNVFG